MLITSCAMMLSCWSSELAILIKLRLLPVDGGDVIVTQYNYKMALAFTTNNACKYISRQ